MGSYITRLLKDPQDTSRVISILINKIGLRRNFPGNLAAIYIKFDSPAPGALFECRTNVRDLK